MAVEKLATVRGLDRGEWDELAADEVFASYGWLRTVEETCTTADEPCYFVIRGTSGLDAAMPCYLQRRAARELDLILFGRFWKLAAGVGLRIGRTLACGARTGLGRHVLARRGATDAEAGRWTIALLDAAEEYARQQGVALCVRNVRDDSEPALLDALNARGYLRTPEMPYTYLDVRWSTFRDYVRDLKRTHPSTAKNIPREVRRGIRTRLTYEQLGDATPEREALHGLLDAHQRRLNGIPFPYDARFLTVLREQMGDRVTFYVARRDGNPTSIVVGFRGGDSIYLPMVGLDYAQQRETFAYFNNSYNVPIDDAITKGLRTVYSGKLLYALKARRGYRLMPLNLYLRVPSRFRRAALRPVIVAQGLRMRAMLARVPKGL